MEVIESMTQCILGVGMLMVVMTIVQGLLSTSKGVKRRMFFTDDGKRAINLEHVTRALKHESSGDIMVFLLDGSVEVLSDDDAQDFWDEI